MLLSRRFGRAAVLSGAIAIAIALPALPAANAAPGAQVARSSGGLIAGGGVPHDPGSNRSFSVTLVVPEGSVTASPSAGLVDLARPWATIVEYGDDGKTLLCSTVTNPTSYNAGASGPGNADVFNASVWKGTYVDLTCDDGSGMDFYRARWEPARYAVLATNPVVTAWNGGQVTTWAAGGMQGAVQVWPLADQPSQFSVCGYRGNAKQVCYGQGAFAGPGAGGGLVVTSTNGMLAIAAPKPV